MSRYITTKADFTLRRKHKKGSGATIYENDYTTINPMPNALKGEYVIGDSNFVFTSRLGINGQKKHVRGKFVPNPSGSTDEKGAWTIDTIIDSGITDETRIRLKPNYNSLRDFACYGSAVKMIQGTVNGVITDFPAEMYLSDDDIKFYGPESGNAGYSDNELMGVLASGKILYNEYSIDITTESLQPENIYNPLRYFALCGSSYTYIEGQNTYDFSGFTVTNTASGTCYNGKSIQIDKLASVELMFSGEQGQKIITVEIFKDYDTDEMFYMYSGGEAGGHIRPKKKIVEDYFRDCDDFTAVLLDRTNKPIYTSSFEAPEETETGIKYEMKSFTWPTIHGGYNPDLSLGYYTYVQGLMDIAAFYDEYFTDNMWRSLTHEAIKTLDWTYVSNTGDEVEEMLDIDTSRIEPIVKLYGRQFDDLKRYADAIKSINTITYNQKSNTPDYTLTDVLENSGWETKTLKITTDNEIATSSLYAGLTSGYTASDVNNEFLRRLKLNSRYLFSIKGTRKGLDTMLAMFGFTPDDYKITEYVSVFSGNSYPNFCESTAQLPSNIKPAFPLAKDISTVNKYKINFNTFDPYGDYCGIPVAEVGYFIENPSDPDKPYDCSYVVPWYSYGKTYDDGLYFQMHGGWGKRRDMDIDLEIAPEVKNITSWEGVVPLYVETQARLKFAKDFDELLQEAYAGSKIRDVFYVTDISKMQEEYSLNGETIESASHYFVLENEELKQFLGYASDYTGLTKYGWRSIDNSEIQDPGNNSAGTLVLYLESIKDDTTGNNPHVGNGTYDDGMAYISGMSQVFNYSLINKNFIGIDDNTCKRISGFSFDVTMQEDNRKCWFFTDFYSSGYGKDVAHEEKIYFRETDVTDYIGDIRNCNDSKLGAYSGCTAADLGYDILDLLEDADLNEEVQIGAYVNSSSTEEVNVSHIYSGETELYSGKTVNGCYTGSPYDTTGFSSIYYYGRESKLDTFNPETREKGKNGEAAANSIVNIKNLKIEFTLPNCSDKDKADFRRYIENSVMPYLTQMIPSTSILSIDFLS